MTQLRDERGRFTSTWQPGAPLTDGAATVLRNLPEVAGLFREGEVFKEYTVPEGHTLVEFWPLLTLVTGYEGKGWELGGACVYDIDHASRPDPNTSSTESVQYHHFSQVLTLRNGSRAEVGNFGVHRYGYDEYNKHFQPVAVPQGSVCRGTASFPNDPFQAALLLRMFHVQTVENSSYVSKGKAYSVQWWKEQGEMWRQRFARPKCIVTPSVDVDSAVVVELEDAWIVRAQKGDWRLPYPIAPEEVQKRKQGEEVLAR